MLEIDLHTHSTASDGTLTPTELVDKAVRIGLKALALTDHDTLQGLPEARSAGNELGLEVIGGCELSVDFSHGSMHIIGLWLPENPISLQTTLLHLATLRRERNEGILDNLQRHGIDATYGELKAIAAGATIGRPHIARLLVSKGAATSYQEAFQNWLRPGTKGYVSKEKLPARQALDILKNEQATIILAHPCTLKITDTQLEETLRELKDMGLDGLEVFYSMHTQAQTNRYAALARALDLLPSAGSDFHGDNKPNIALGRGKGGLRPSYDLVRHMKERRATQGYSL